jgi:predicted enzyme related to lactoylglutathione lyase
VRDPFTDLRDPGRPVDPDPVFAADLRARLERALALPKGVVPVTTTTLTEPERVDTEPRPAAVPYLAVADARAALDWYQEVFGAELSGDPIVMPDGRVGHAELALSGGVIYLSDAHPELGVTAPRAGESSVSLMLPVHDADAVRERAMAAGASGDRPPYEGYGHRNAWIVDPFGHRWGLSSPLPEPTVPSYRAGDLAYASLWVPDERRAAAFYADLLGWAFDASGRHVVDVTPSIGVHSTAGAPTLFCCFAVDDVTAAVARVRAAGGEAGEPTREPFGVVAECVDDQGTKFALWQVPADGTDRETDSAMAYLTLEVVDSARAQAFYGSVLGWRFEHGSIEDGWQVVGTTPMAGLSGGHERATAVPMWSVADIARAVETVRAHGGTATDPERQPYGLTASCIDDQGMRFYLGG